MASLSTSRVHCIRASITRGSCCRSQEIEEQSKSWRGRHPNRGPEELELPSRGHHIAILNPSEMFYLPVKVGTWTNSSLTQTRQTCAPFFKSSRNPPIEQLCCMVWSDHRPESEGAMATHGGAIRFPVRDGLLGSCIPSDRAHILPYLRGPTPLCIMGRPADGVPVPKPRNPHQAYVPMRC